MCKPDLFGLVFEKQHKSIVRLFINLLFTPGIHRDLSLDGLNGVEIIQKLDYRKELKVLYAPSVRKVELVEVPCFQFLMIDGAIEPGFAPATSPEFQESTQALYSAAYTLKFASKLHPENPVDFSVMPLEGLWWVEDGDFKFDRKDNWVYRLMILQPPHVSQEMFQSALGQIRKKKGDQPAFAKLRLEDFHEGLSVQILHIGPYAEEPASVAKMDEFAREKGCLMQGRHHEIYLSNPLSAPPEKMKTILRHPVRSQQEPIPI